MFTELSPGRSWRIHYLKANTSNTTINVKNELTAIAAFNSAALNASIESFDAKPR